MGAAFFNFLVVSLVSQIFLQQLIFFCLKRKIKLHDVSVSSEDCAMQVVSFNLGHMYFLLGKHRVQNLESQVLLKCAQYEYKFLTNS